MQLDFMSAREYCERLNTHLWSSKDSREVKSQFGFQRFWSYSDGLDCQIGNINGFILENEASRKDKSDYARNTILNTRVMYGLTNCAHFFPFLCQS